jgi:hypothetical protein
VKPLIGVETPALLKKPAMNTSKTPASGIKPGMVLVLTPTASRSLANNDPFVFAEVLEVVKQGRSLIVKVKVAGEDGKYTIEEVVYLAEDTVTFVANVLRSGTLRKVWNFISSLFNLKK